jgi:hypothetical protein
MFIVAGVASVIIYRYADLGALEINPQRRRLM